ncbi:MAG: HDOD domain-containing protein, partial [Verrucomicrobiota bacterium]
MSRWLGFSIREDLAGSPEAAATPAAGRALVLPRRGSPEERELRERAAARALARMAGVSEELLRTKPPLDWRHTQVVLQDLRELPSLKNLARRFAGRLSGEDCPLDELAAEVGRDPALALNVLRLANSVAVGSRERVADLPTALHLLGVERVRRLALLLAAMGDARGVAPGFDWGQLWLHSAACAALAEQLAGWSGVGAGAEARLAGLLHDVGKIALSAVAPDAYRAVLVA